MVYTVVISNSKDFHNPPSCIGLRSLIQSLNQSEVFTYKRMHYVVCMTQSECEMDFAKTKGLGWSWMIGASHTPWSRMRAPISTWSQEDMVLNPKPTKQPYEP